MIAEELALYLQEQGYGTKGSDLFLGYQPDTPDNCIVVYDESTPISEDSHTLSVDLVGVQILIRDKSYIHARNKAVNIHSDLAGFGGRPFIDDGIMVHALFIETSPTSIGMDDKARSEWSSHYRLRIESIGDKFRN